jgi:hypothetical protein
MIAVIVGIATVVATWWVWGAWKPLPVVQDEYSYVLQSRIFSTLHFTAPTPPAAALFQQPHVLTLPAVASKYPPGHALVLSLGSAVGAPWLAALGMGGLSGALVFLLGSEFLGIWGGLIGWAVWLSDPIGLRFRPGYYSEVTSEAMWLLSWYALFRWRKTDDTRWLYGLAAACGVAAITRPLSALALAIPIGVIVVGRVAARRSWQPLLVALCVGSAFVALLPVWSFGTTGDWTTSPWTLYRKEYLPFDKPGFGLDSAAPLLPLSPVNADVYAEFAPEHARHTVANLSAIARERIGSIVRGEWSGSRVILLPLFLLGVLAGGAAVRFVVASAVCLFAAYLSYGHWRGWTIYYLEASPALALATGAAFVWVVSRVGTRTPGMAARVIVVLLVSLIGVRELRGWRVYHVVAGSYDGAFQSMLHQLPAQKGIVFVRYGENVHPHTNVVANSPTLERDRFWVVRDVPAMDSILLRAAPDRVPFLFDESTAQVRLYRELLPAGQ